ncbi:hypothetical protein HNR48_000241 [Pseudoteredinibacter isoporae]|uniref:Uncharacterized protein n=1 Tax=Pseudoteredinibacter isoporae TaxID=570281 RepID=A0A7X0MU70_9GAMM|nr:hypothetical protein [Pseudoteredinibacter isoporae]
MCTSQYTVKAAVDIALATLTLCLMFKFGHATMLGLIESLMHAFTVQNAECELQKDKRDT